MQRYTTNALNQFPSHYPYIPGPNDVYLASDVDSAIAAAVKREREEIADMVAQYDMMMAQRIRARGESKPEPHYTGYQNPLPGEKPAKIERLHPEHKVSGRVVEVEVVDKLNELIDAWNGGKA
jgi:hypothetical protein